MSRYSEITRGWPDNERVNLLTKDEIKHLVNANSWHKLGRIFNFVPVFHFEGKNFIDWRCVPQALMDYIKKNPSQKFPSNLHAGVLNNMNRVQKRKHIRQLMLKAEWKELKDSYGFSPRFVEMPNGKRVIDWSCIPWNIHEILKCGGVIKRTEFTESGGIYHADQKPKAATYKVKKKGLIPAGMRIARHTLEERIPIRLRLYENQQGKCHYCKVFIPPESRFWTTDHKLPISRGGTNEDSNLVGACEDCNSNKSWLTEEEFFKSEFLKNKLKNYEAAKNL